jgi:PGF-CTERM protein
VDAATGEQEWAFDTGNDVSSSPTVVDSTVYVGSVDSNLYAVDAVTGEQEWAFDTGEQVRSSPTVVSDPQNGDSIGSRVMLGTLGHHGDWRYAGQSTTQAEFSVSVRETNGPVAGEDLSATVEVTANTGGSSVTQDVSLSVPALGSDAQQVTLSGGDTTTVTLSVPTSPGDGGTYTLTVTSQDSEATTSVTVDAVPDDDESGSDNTSNESESDGSSDRGGRDESGGGNGDDDSGGENESNESSGDGSGPGFGVGGALAGVGGAGYLLKRRLGDENRE